MFYFVSEVFAIDANASVAISRVHINAGIDNTLFIN